MKRVNVRDLLFVVTVIAIFGLGTICGGCTTAAERQFTVADTQVIGLYVQKAQPAVEAYCTALEASGHAQSAQQLRVDTRLMATEMTASANARLAKLDSNQALIDSARAAVAMAIAAIDEYKARQPSIATSGPSQ